MKRENLSLKSQKSELDWMVKLSFPKSFPCQKLCLRHAWYYRVCPRLVMKIRGSCKRELYWWHPHHPLNLKRSVTFWQKTNSVGWGLDKFDKCHIHFRHIYIANMQYFIANQKNCHVCRTYGFFDFTILLRRFLVSFGKKNFLTGEVSFTYFAVFAMLEICPYSKSKEFSSKGLGCKGT